MPLYGDGLQVRDWIHVLDHCNALLSVLERGQVGEIYNIGARAEKTNRELAELFVRILGKSPALIQEVRDRPGHDRRYALDTTKIQSTLAWKPERSFEEGVEATVRWYRTHTEWWNRLKGEKFWEYFREIYGPVEK